MIGRCKQAAPSAFGRISLECQEAMQIELRSGTTPPAFGRLPSRMKGPERALVRPLFLSKRSSIVWW